MKKSIYKISNVIYEEKLESEKNESYNKRSPDKLKENEDHFIFQLPKYSEKNENLKKEIIENEIKLKYYQLKEKELEIQKNLKQRNKDLNLEKINPIDYKTVFNYFYKLDYTNIQKQIKIKIQNESFCSKCFSCSNLKLKPRLNKEREMFFYMSKVQYNENINEHFRILSTIYQFFTKKNYCPKKGEHWDLIGLIGLNPENDINKIFMLNPVQILYLIEKYPKFSFLFYQFLFINRCEWLFCSILFNLSNSILEILSKGKINQFCNKREHVFPVVNDIFCGMCFKLYNYIKEIKNVYDCLTAEFISFKVDEVIKLCLHYPNSFLFQEFNSLENNEKNFFNVNL